MPHSVTQAIEAFARGEIVIVTDDDDRENEGDLIVAASLCTPEKMAFIIRNTCGIVCAPLTGAEARRLRLDPMVSSNDAPLGTAFTVTVDVKHGLTTGISAEQRCNTVRALANGNMGAADFVRPGHVFPLIAKDGGVLMRSGHTEAAVDLCKLAELPPVGVICELANDDGTVMKGPQITAFAEKHGLKQIIGRRSHRLSPGAREAGRAGAFLPGQDRIRRDDRPCLHHALREHAAFRLRHGQDRRWRGRAGAAAPGRCRRGRAGRRAVHPGRAAALPAGRQAACSIYLRDGSAGVPVKSVEDDSDAQRSQQWREVGLGAQILRDLGVTSIINLASSPRSFVGLSGFGIEIPETQPLE